MNEASNQGPRIAIVGASSQIAKDLICSFLDEQNTHLLLYVRDITAAVHWVQNKGLDTTNCTIHDYAEYGKDPHDVVINFVGVGDPQRAAAMGASIFDLTLKFDSLILNDLQHNPKRKYIFLSSGAAYGDVFKDPAKETTSARFDINSIKQQDYYAISKLHAEARHRSCSDLAITDIRVFNYFSRTQDLNARFFITDCLRAIRDKQILRTSADNIVRDFLHPNDFFQLINCILKSGHSNSAVDCYTRKASEKKEILGLLQQKFGLNYTVIDSLGDEIVNATGTKQYYYSINRAAKKYGYVPKYSSLECVEKEASAIIANIR